MIAVDGMLNNLPIGTWVYNSICTHLHTLCKRELPVCYGIQTVHQQLHRQSSARVSSSLIPKGTQRAYTAKHADQWAHSHKIVEGHSTLDTVRVYLKIAQVDIDTMHRKASPVDNWRL